MKLNFGLSIPLKRILQYHKDTQADIVYEKYIGDDGVLVWRATLPGAVYHQIVNPHNVNMTMQDFIYYVRKIQKI
jgi:hypothetical protein